MSFGVAAAWGRSTMADASTSPARASDADAPDRAQRQSRAWDEAGNIQPTRAEFVASRGELKTAPPVAAVLNQHCNAVTSWAIDSSGEIKHAYA
jgi:hypothetical protein